MALSKWKKGGDPFETSNNDKNRCGKATLRGGLGRGKRGRKGQKDTATRGISLSKELHFKKTGSKRGVFSVTELKRKKTAKHQRKKRGGDSDRQNREKNLPEAIDNNNNLSGGEI